MELGLIFGIVLVLLVLTFGTLTIIFSLKTWHWLHITGVCLVMVTLVPAMYYMAAYARTTNAWGDVFNKTSKSLDEAETNNLKLRVGDPPTSANPTDPGKIQLVAALDRLMIQRGRIWRNCAPAAFVPAANGRFTSKISTLPPNTPPAEAPKFKNGIAPQTEVFIFRELYDAGNQLTGYVYLGRFGVVAATESDIDVTPNEYLDPQQATVFAPGVFLTIYEALPADDNGVFSDWPAETREAEIRRIFATLAPGQPGATGLTQESFDALVESFIRHGGEKRDTDLPEEVWTRVKIVDAEPIEVDAESVSGTDTQLFDSFGRAIRGTLQRGEPVKFNKGDEVVLDSVTADEWIRAGKAEKIADVYRRVEKDFDTSFRILNKKAIDLTAEMQKVQRNIASIEETLKKLESEIAYRTKEKGMLETDLTKFQNDATVMSRLSTELNDAYQKLVDRLSTVYRNNIDMLAKIAEVDEKLTEEIDRRSQTAVNK
jgi:succinate dehydrogenase flavin-adding protein (antitoxin of CptAB toxin-antitoxin module)